MVLGTAVDVFYVRTLTSSDDVMPHVTREGTNEVQDNVQEKAPLLPKSVNRQGIKQHDMGEDSQVSVISR